jgi:ABC-type lipoprotein release transport system permease subunit
VKADKRARQRQMIERLAPYTIALVLAVAAAWVTALAVMNVRERYSEIGILRAIGYGTGTIAMLVLGRAILIGLVAALIGFALGSWFGLAVGPQLFPMTAAAIRVNWQLLGWALLAAPTLAAVASFIPAMVAVSHDPAVTLRES